MLTILFGEKPWSINMSVHKTWNTHSELDLFGEDPWQGNKGITRRAFTSKHGGKTTLWLPKKQRSWKKTLSFLPDFYGKIPTFQSVKPSQQKTTHHHENSHPLNPPTFGILLQTVFAFQRKTQDAPFSAIATHPSTWSTRCYPSSIARWPRPAEIKV